jgi:hypothetical protein
VLQVFNKTLSERYLGTPDRCGLISHRLTGAFSYLKDRVWKKVQGWMEQSLSTGGKEVLIKAVAQAIPTYSIVCFRLPRGLCNIDIASYATSDGAAKKERGRPAVSQGMICCCQKDRVGSVSGTSSYSTKLCWRAKLGEFCRTRDLSAQGTEGSLLSRG